MAELMVRNGEWVVVCDGAKALVFENAGDAQFPNFKTLEVLDQKDLPTREQGTDEPGRAFSSVGSGRSSYEQTDWQGRSEEAFLIHLARRLDAAVSTGKAKSLILAAPPRALGMIRHAYTPALRNALRAELDKDLVKLPVHEIEKHLTGA